jgi:hypothetical protein
MFQLAAAESGSLRQPISRSVVRADGQNRASYGVAVTTETRPRAI